MRCIAFSSMVSFSRDLARTFKTESDEDIKNAFSSLRGNWRNNGNAALLALPGKPRCCYPMVSQKRELGVFN